jgi:hypothetical protein
MWDGWLCFLSRNRDSGLLENHNFKTALATLEEVNADHPTDDTVTVLDVTENHWAVGWVQWIAIHPSNERAVALARSLAKRLDNYPILDECSYSEKEGEACVQAWRDLSVSDRIDLIKRKGDCSILAARHPWPPDDDGIRDTLERWVNE